MNFTDKLNARLGLAVGAETFHKLTTENHFNDWLNIIDWNQLHVEFPNELVEQKLAEGINKSTLSELVKAIDQYYFDQYKKAEDANTQQLAQWNEIELNKSLENFKSY